MSRPSHAFSYVVALVSLALALPAPAQELAPPIRLVVGDGKPAEANPRLHHVLRSAHEHLAAGRWNSLAHALRMLLDLPDGIVLTEQGRSAKGRSFTRWYSPQPQLVALLANLPPEALKAYEGHYGNLDSARLGHELLERARKSKDVRLLAEAVRRSLGPDTSFQGLRLLADHHFRAQHSLQAALCYRRLLEHPRTDALSADDLLRAALVCRRAGDAAGFQRAADRLVALAQKDALVLDGRKVSEAALRKELERLPPRVAASDWGLFRGDPTRNAQPLLARPDLGRVLWQRDFVRELTDELTAPGAAKEAAAWIERALKEQASNEQARVPGFFPLAAGDLVFYRNYSGVSAVYARTVKDAQGTVEGQPGEICWRSTDLDGCLPSLINDPQTRAVVTDWLQRRAKGQLAPALLENAFAAALSADERFVYVVDDVALPPPPAPAMQRGKPQPKVTSARLDILLQQNSLHAYGLTTGKLTWRLGGAEQLEGPFARSHWLGPPLPLGGLLYALNETNDGTVRLLALDPREGGKALSLRSLVKVQQRFQFDELRRQHPAHLAHADGVLVCPTHAGVVVGVDLATEEVLWAYAYRPARSAGETPNAWRASAPVIHDGKVLVAGPDDEELHCLRLRDGVPLWRVARSDDVYLAGVFGGKVLLVGKGSCRALALDTGKELWELQTGTPSGVGTGGGELYYLPLRRGALSKKAEVAVLDVRKGQIVRRVPCDKGGPPGNLIVHQGMLVSQTATEIVVYALPK